MRHEIEKHFKVLLLVSATVIILLVGTSIQQVRAQSAAQREASSYLLDNTSLAVGTNYGHAIGGFDGTNFELLSVDSDGKIDVNSAPPQATPQTPQTLACDTDPTGGPTFTANASDMRLEIWNTGSTDVCLQWGASASPDISDLTTCSIRIGADAAAGNSSIYITPADMKVGSEAFRCDVAAGTSTLVITAWRES